MDEGPRKDTSLEVLAKLKPAFLEGGTVTAGNSSQMSDGAAAVVVTSRAKAESLGMKPLVRFVAYAVGGVPPEIMGIGPVVAVPKALEIAGLSLKDIGLIELNEAFAAQYLGCEKELGLNREITNVNGSGIGIGHPIGATGARIMVTLMYAMKKRGNTLGLAALCGGGGVSMACALEML